MIHPLDRKLLRDLWQIKGQSLAIAAVMACGLAVFVMMMSAMESLVYSQSVYYERYRFGDVFASLKRAPLTLLHRLEQIPGVLSADARIVKDVTLSLENFDEPATGRLISAPPSGGSGLNLVHLRLGRFPEASGIDEVLVNEAFAEAHRLKPGDTVDVIMNGRLRTLEIVGVALSPEYIYLIRPGDLIPDPARFGIFWMNRKALEAAFDMEGAFNDASFKLAPSTNRAEVIRQIDDLTKAFGGFGAYERYDQMSNRVISDEINNLRTVGTMIPSVFMAVAAFLLNLVVGRIIGTQREQIAAIKALGYTHWAIGWHYTKLALLIVTIGFVVGIAGGIYLGQSMTRLYTSFFDFPVLYYNLTPRLVVAAGFVAILAGVLGTIGSVRRAVILPPAEAMRPEPPAHFRATIIERLGLVRFFSNSTLMVIRHLERTPGKSAMSILGIAMAVGMLILGRCTADGLLHMIDLIFSVQQRQDLLVTFVEPRGMSALFEAERLPGVLSAEGFRSVPVRLRHGHRHRRTAIMGLQPRAELFRLLDANVHQITIPEGGLLLAEKMGEMLGASPGDHVTIEVLEGARPVHEVVVSGYAKEYLGSTPYMQLASLNAVMQEGSNISGVHLTADARYVQDLYKMLKETPYVAGVTIKEAAVENFNKTLAETLMVMVTFQTAFSVIIAFGVVYNAARIAVSERGRELASLRVLGFTRGEISAILLGELAILTIVAIPVGLLLGHLGSYLAVQSFDTDIVRIPFHLESATYARAALTTIVAAVASGLIVRRRLDHLDLIAVLKTKE